MSAPIPVTKQFSDQEQTNIIELYDSGETQAEIGKKYGVSRRTIMKLLNALGKHKTHSEAQKPRFVDGFVEKVMELRGSGETIETIGAITNRSTSAVYRVIKKLGDNKPKEVGLDIDNIISEYGSGTPANKVAQKYGTSSFKVLDILRDNGVGIRSPAVDGGGSISQKIVLDDFINTEQWWINAHIKYGTPTLAKFTGWTKYKVKQRLFELGVGRLSLSERMVNLDKKQIVANYQELGSMSLVAQKHGCSIQAIKNHLQNAGVQIKTSSEIMGGEGNPFYGKKHPDNIKEYCTQIGATEGKKFWDDNPEYIEVVKEKQKLIWADLNKRRESSRKIAELRKQGKCNSRKGTIVSRFGDMQFDSSYECAFIEWCDSNSSITHLERDFMIIEYNYNGGRCFVPDFKLWLQNGEFLIVEIKSDWLARQLKERAKIESGFGLLLDKFMTAANNFDLVGERIKLVLEPAEFEFSDIELHIADSSSEYDGFYAAFHYMGKTGRRGYTMLAKLSGKTIAVATFSSITRIESAKRLGMNPGEVRELVRFCIHPDFHKKNFGSWFLSRATSKYLADNRNVNTILTFADTTVGHTGALYKATNWSYDGDTKPSYRYVDAKGNITHKKTMYNHAKDAGIPEREYAEQNGYIRVREEAKKRFVYKR